MAIDFDNLLSVEQKIKLVSDRIQQFASEAYQYKLNRETAVITEMQRNIDAADNALIILEQAIKVHQEELNQLLSTQS